MFSREVIVIVIIVVVCLATIRYFINKGIRKEMRIIHLVKSYPTLAKALLNIKEIPNFPDISRKQSKTLLSLSIKEWDEWEALSKRVLALANLFPETVFEFIKEHIPEYKERIPYKENAGLFTPISQRVIFAVNSLYKDELHKIDADSEAIWKQRDELRLLANKIRQKYPEGFRTYCSIHKTVTPLNSLIVNDKRQIFELQKLYDVSKGYEGWEKKQEDFCSKFWQMLKDVRSQDGRYPYDVSFKKPNRKGSLVESKFKVWQGFTECYSSHLLEKQADNFKANYNKIAPFKNRNRYFYERVYEQIFEIIEKFDAEVEGDLYVILVNRCKLNWPESSYNYHYSHICELIDRSDIRKFNFSELPHINDNGNIGGIFIFDFITSNEELMNNCKLIIEHFNISVPLIGYYSMLKEYDESELKELAKVHEGYLVNEEDNKEEIFEDKEDKIELAEKQEEFLNEDDDEETDIEFIKNSILQIRKHPFFSYIAIPNTWIGEASDAERTKRKWLDNPSQYLFKTKDKEGCISGEYSVDGGESYADISIEGDGYNIDDTTLFSYKLLKRMGVLCQFKENGHKAIEYMNSIGSLAYH